MHHLARITAKVKGKQYDGAMIIKAVWQKEDLPDNDEPEIIKENRKMLVCKAIYHGESLTVTMLLNYDGTVKKVIKNHNEYDIKLCQSFTREDVWEFVDSVGDTNPIHQGNQPVVPGLLLMEYIKNKLPTSVKKLELSFRNAIFANEVFKLAIDGNNFKLWGKREFVTGNFYE